MQQLHPKAVWLFFLRSILIFLFILLIILILIAAILVKQIEEKQSVSFGWIMFFVIYAIFCLIFSYIWAKFSYRYWRYELTEDAFKKEKGVIWKKYISIPYERIQNVDIYRGIFSRMLGLSELHIQIRTKTV